MRRAGVRAAVRLADLRDRSACLRLADQAWQEWGGLDVCVNNAGADTLTGEAAAWPFERKLEELLAVDVTATMLLARAVGRRMKEAGGGVILNMGWDQAGVGMEGDSGELFAAAKGAVMAFSKSLALSLAPEVRVHCLAPGWIRTAWGRGASAAWQERVMRETPLAALGSAGGCGGGGAVAGFAGRTLSHRADGARQRRGGAVTAGQHWRVEAVGKAAAVDVEGFEDSAGRDRWRCPSCAPSR